MNEHRAPEEQVQGQQNPEHEQGYQLEPVVSKSPTLASLGFESREAGREWDPDEAGRVQIKFAVSQPGNIGRIMLFGYNRHEGRGNPNSPGFGIDDFTLFVQWIAMEYDSRPRSQRPKARELLAAVWVHIIRRPLMLLRRVYFEAVIESTTRNVIRDTVCPLKDIGWDEEVHSPTEQFTLFRPGRITAATQVNDEAFQAACESSKLVKTVASMPKKYPEMLQPGCPLPVVEIKITPSHGHLGEQGAFDMEIVLEDEDASDSS